MPSEFQVVVLFDMATRGVNYDKKSHKHLVVFTEPSGQDSNKVQICGF